ncbi:MAG: isoamylase early set domain-containing protein [Desulfobacterales bacterium]|jgi:1,4-alpha-glucan branching enzyme
MAIKKNYLKTKPICKVTFKIPAEGGNAAKSANIVGEFNNWSFTANPMKKMRNGAFSTTLELEKGRGYQFRYLLDKNKWENEAEADKFVPSPYGDSENSVIIL